VVSRSVEVRFYNFEIVIEKEAEDEGYSAYSPSLPGCFSNGRTIEEARRNMREAIQQHVAALLAHGEPVPQSERLVQSRSPCPCTPAPTSNAAWLYESSKTQA
jgi:antitoxin HicB